MREHGTKWGGKTLICLDCAEDLNVLEQSVRLYQPNELIWGNLESLVYKIRFEN